MSCAVALLPSIYLVVYIFVILYVRINWCIYFISKEMNNNKQYSLDLPGERDTPDAVQNCFDLVQCVVVAEAYPGEVVS